MPPVEKLKFTDILAFASLIMAFSVILIVFFFYSKSTESVAMLILGFCTGSILLIENYYFGNSKSGATKDSTILSMQQENKDNNTSSVTIQNAENVTDKSTANVDKADTINTNVTNIAEKKTDENSPT